MDANNLQDVWEKALTAAGLAGAGGLGAFARGGWAWLKKRRDDARASVEEQIAEGSPVRVAEIEADTKEHAEDRARLKLLDERMDAIQEELRAMVKENAKELREKDILLANKEQAFCASEWTNKGLMEKIVQRDKQIERLEKEIDGLERRLARLENR